MLFEPIEKDRFYKHIVHQITRSILTGQMQPGDQLPTEPELAEQFDVSRTVVREAIKALNMQGLVSVTPGRGTFITQPPIETVTNSLHMMLTFEDHPGDDLIVARRILEIPIVRLAAEHATTENIAALQEYLDGMRAAQDAPEDFIAHDTAFHAELARATQNAVLSVLIQPIIMLLQGTRETLVRVPSSVERALKHHERVFDAIKAGDADNAEQAMLAHLDQVEEDTDRAQDFS